MIYFIGYTYSFPFLSVDCGLTLKDRLHVEPLYKEIININRPTMAIIGLSVCVFTYLRHDLQVSKKFSSIFPMEIYKYLNNGYILLLKANLCLKYWNGEIEIPSKVQMLEELHIENEKQKESGIESRHCHLILKNLV